MVKLLVDVFMPGNGKTYEFQLDGAMPVAQATAQIISSICEAENDAVKIDPGTAILSDSNISKRLNAGKSLQSEGVKSGHRLILV